MFCLQFCVGHIHSSTRVLVTHKFGYGWVNNAVKVLEIAEKLLSSQILLQYPYRHVSQPNKSYTCIVLVTVLLM